MNPPPWSGLGADVRQAFRQLRKSKGLTIAMLATLALCIGITTAIFSMVYALMLKPLPFREAERIVELYGSAVKAGLNKMPSNVVHYLDYSRNATSYESLGLWQPSGGIFGDEGSAEQLAGARVTADLFEVLRVQPLLGQFFTREQNRPGADKVVVLTQSFWEKQFNEDPAVLDQVLRIDGESLRIIGVAPRVVETIDARVRYLQPLSWPPEAEDPNRRYALYLNFLGRLKPGVTAEQADAEAKALEARYYDAAPPPIRQFIDRSGVTLNVRSAQAERVQPVRTSLYLLQAAVAFVLLIGCVNVANLLLVRANARQSELAVRFALGARRGVIARQLLVESLMLTMLGAVAGIGLAWAALQAINHYTAELLPHALPMSFDVRVLSFAVALTIIVGVMIGLVPVLHLWRTNLTEVIQRGGRSASAGRGVRTLSGTLVVAQVAVALVLLTGAGLLIQSFARVLNTDPGFDPRHVIVGRVALPAAHRASDEAARAIQDRLVRASEEIPGVSRATVSASTPYHGGLPLNALTLEDDVLPPGTPQPGAYLVMVTPSYLDTLRLRLVEGRFFETTDQNPEFRRVVVDESFARKFFPNRSPIGGRFTFGGRPEKPEDWITIIGVVRDVPHNGVEDRTGNPFVYHLAQGRPGGLTLFLRTDRPLSDVVPLLREKVRAIDPAIPLFDTRSLEDAMELSFDRRRAVMLLLVAFAGLALFLSALGIYGVLAYDVSQRTREIGIRGAIGATRGQLIGMVLRQGFWRTALGLAVGLIGAWLLSRFMTSLLFEVEPTEPFVYLTGSIILLLVAALSSYLPARRAAAIDPLVALRTE